MRFALETATGAQLPGLDLRQRSGDRMQPIGGFARTTAVTASCAAESESA